MSADRNRTYYLGTASGPDNFANVNETPQYKPGELGSIVPDVANSRRWQKVVCDSGATAATATGVVAAGQLAFWKDKSQYIVTNDSTQANAVNAPAGGWGNAGNATLDARNFVAGIFTNAVTAGNATLILQRTDQKAGYNVLAAAGGTYNAGNMLVANTGTAADGTTVNAGTAPTCVVIGVVLGARSGGKAPIWVNLPEDD